MPKCENCGKEFNGNFCPECGTKAEAKASCPNCGAELNSGANFCPLCGKPVSAETTEPVKQSIKNETKRDLEFEIRLSENMLSKRTRLMMFMLALGFLVCGAIVFGVEYLMSDGESYDIYFPIFFAALGVFFFVFALVFKPFVRRSIQKNMQGKQSTNAYTFAENGYEVVTKMNDGTQSTASGNYMSFTEAKEFKDMWLLYINKATVFPVAKDGMTEGTAEELSALLVRAMGARYKVCYKK